MYDLLYIISKYYKKQQDDKVFNDEQTNKLCLICWLPSNKNETIQNMKNISHIVVICDCNPIFHKKCLDIWINKTSSCPICRKKITITSEIIITETTINKHIDILTYAIFIYNIATNTLRFATCITIIHLFLQCFYIIVYFRQQRFDEY
jgi:hypothetical protein